MVTILAKREFDSLLHEPCYVCSVQTNSKDTSIKPEKVTLPSIQSAVKRYFDKKYKVYTIYFSTEWYDDVYSSKKSKYHS